MFLSFSSFLVVALFSCVQFFATPWTAVQQASCHSLSSGVCSNSCPLSRWCHPTILSSAVPFSSCPQSFPASGSFPMSRLFESGSRSIGASVSTSFLPVNIQGWFPLGLTGLISLLSKIFSRLFSTTSYHSSFLKSWNTNRCEVNMFWLPSDKDRTLTSKSQNSVDIDFVASSFSGSFLKFLYHLASWH